MPALGLPATKQSCDGCGRPRALLCLPRHRGPDRGVARSEYPAHAQARLLRDTGTLQGGERAGHQVGVSALGEGLPSRPQRRRQVVRDEVQGAERGLRGAARPAEACRLRPVRPRRLRRAAGRGGARLRARLRLLHVGHLRRPVRRVHGRTARPRPALGPRARRRPALQHGDHAAGGLRRQDRADPRADQRHLRGLHRHRRQEPAPSPRPARPAAAPARCAPARASSPSSAPAPPARGAARSSTIRAPPAAARAA